MQLGFRRVLSLGVIAALAGLSACQKEDNAQHELAAAQEAVVAELEEAKQALDAQRQELADLKAKLAAPDSETEGEEGAEAFDAEAAMQRVEELKADIESAADDLGSRIVSFINEDPPLQGEPLTDRQQRAIDIKIDEDILLARDYIEEGGDYKRAISILEGLQPLAPDHAGLAKEIAKAEEMRFMTEERFSAVKKGMTENEVREALGPVNLRNVRPYEEKKVTAWFYPKEDGGAAGVWFEEKKGQLVAYKTDFNAVKAGAGEEADG